MLPPTPNRRARPELSLSEDRGYSQKVTRGKGGVKVTRVFSPCAPKVFRRGQDFEPRDQGVHLAIPDLCHLIVASAAIAL